MHGRSDVLVSYKVAIVCSLLYVIKIIVLHKHFSVANIVNQSRDGARHPPPRIFLWVIIFSLIACMGLGQSFFLLRLYITLVCLITCSFLHWFQPNVCQHFSFVYCMRIIFLDTNILSNGIFILLFHKACKIAFGRSLKLCKFYDSIFTKSPNFVKFMKI